MKNIGRSILDSLALALLAGCICSGPANAQQSYGKFTLPVEAQWKGITLPPGHYTFRFERPLGTMAVAREGRHLAMILADSVDHEASSQSSLVLQEAGGVVAIRELRLAGSDLVLNYGPARAAGRKVLETRRMIPVTLQGASVKRTTVAAPPMPGTAGAAHRSGMGIR